MDISRFHCFLGRGHSAFQVWFVLTQGLGGVGPANGRFYYRWQMQAEANIPKFKVNGQRWGKSEKDACQIFLKGSMENSSVEKSP